MYKVAWWAGVSDWRPWQGLSDVAIRRSLQEFDRFRLVGNSIVSPGLLVRIDWTSTNLIVGVVRKAVNELGLWTMEGYERAEELKRILFQRDGKYDVTYVNADANQVIDDLLAPAGWRRGSALVSSAVLPAYFDVGKFDMTRFDKIFPVTTPLVTVHLTNTDIAGALKKIVCDMFNNFLWFDNLRKVVYFGRSR